MSEEQPTGAIVWKDLTVEDASAVRDFYSEVVGWRHEAVDMGEYSDFNMLAAEGGPPQAGICHARGPNAAMPAQWMLYVSVDDVAASVRRAVELGGEVVDGPRTMGEHHFAVIRDPAGAVLAVIGE